MSSAGFSLSFAWRVAVCASALCAGASASDPEPPLRIAVARPADSAHACARPTGILTPGEESAPHPSEWTAPLASALVDSLRIRGVEAVADTTLARWLGRLDGRFPDPRDYGRTRDYLASTGAKRLVYVNGLRATKTCALRFEAALWNTEPLARRAARSDSATTPDEAAGILARWLTKGLAETPPEQRDAPP